MPQVLQIGDEFKYGDYLYKYKAFYNGYDWTISGESAETVYDGWGVRVIDTSKENYGEMLDIINGKDVVDLSCTFYGCERIKIAPAIPIKAITITGVFFECQNLVVAPVIPESVIDIRDAFGLCENLKGTINANPNTYIDCFKGTDIEAINGSCPESKKQLILQTK